MDEETLDIRRRHGCDRDAEEDVFETTCDACGGTRWLDLPDGAGVARCDECNGTGAVERFRCPGSIQASDPALSRFLSAYGRLREFGAWPTEGSVEDQAATFVNAVGVLEGELGEIRAAERREEEIKRRGGL